MSDKTPISHAVGDGKHTLASAPAPPAAATPAEPPLYTDSRKASRLGLIALLIGFGGFAVWAATAPLDEGVPAPGVVNVESKRKAVQHLRGGIVEEIRVAEGDPVRAGDVLVTLNDTEIRAQLDITIAQYWAALAVEARLGAEREEAREVRFPEALTGNRDDPRAQAAMIVQTELFHARRETLNSQVGMLRESLKGLQEQINGLEALQAGKQRQIELLEEELNAVRGLVSDGFVPRVRMMELERMLADLTGSRTNDLANIARLQSNLDEVRLRIAATTQEFGKDVRQHLSEVQKEAGTHHDRITALREELTRTELRAPSDGIVVGLNAFTIGGVIPPGQTIMEIVPQDEALLIEAQIPTHLIEKITPGLEADIRFATVKGAQMTPITGVLITVSADRLVDPQTGMPYYLGRIQVTPESLRALIESRHPIHPGMAADVVIKTGERTLLDYLINPLKTRIAGALKEI